MSTKTKNLEAIRVCLRNSPVADSLPEGWEDQLFGKHLEHPERAIQETTIIPMEFGWKPGWFSLHQAGGGLRIAIWSPRFHLHPAARAHIDELKQCLESVLPSHLVQIRGVEPPGELLRKLRSSPNGTVTRR